MEQSATSGCPKRVLAEADEQSGRIGRLLRAGQLTSQVILLRVHQADG